MSEPTNAVEERAYRKVSWRLIPFLFLCYVVAYLDRVNVGFAKLQMAQALLFSDTIYGLGAGMFFIGNELPTRISAVGPLVTVCPTLIPCGEMM